MNDFFSSEIGGIIKNVCVSIILAVLIFIIGRIIINVILKAIQKMKFFQKLDETVRKYLLNIIKAVLYVIMVIAIIGVLGVPIASVITVLATAGVAVGLALQGSLSNFAGGIMLLIFKPFKVGDYIQSGGDEGVVQEISMIYTVINTVDNKVISIPNGTLMNANITNYSREGLRRVDLTFICGRDSNIDTVQNTMIDVMKKNAKVIQEADGAAAPPFAQLSGGTNEAMEFTGRAWCKTEDYWDVHFALIHDISVALGEAGVTSPSVRVVKEEKQA